MSKKCILEYFCFSSLISTSRVWEVFRDIIFKNIFFKNELLLENFKSIFDEYFKYFKATLKSIFATLETILMQNT